MNTEHRIQPHSLFQVAEIKKLKNRAMNEDLNNIRAPLKAISAAFFPRLELPTWAGLGAKLKNDYYRVTEDQRASMVRSIERWWKF